MTKSAVDLIGGIGNQLFQISFADYVQSTGAEVVLNDWYLPEESSQVTNLFRVKCNLATQTVGPLPALSRLASWARVGESFRSRVNRLVGVEWANDFTSTELSNRRRVRTRYHGYFQNFEVARRCFSSFRQTLNAQASESVREIEKDLGAHSAIAVHIRLGDYELIRGAYGPLSPNFYKRALQGHWEATNSPKQVFVFSDGDPMQRPEFSFLSDFGPIRLIGGMGLSDLDELYLMSKCHSIIISNSTFSWWGAALSSHKSVTYPNPWLKGQAHPTKLTPEFWKSLDPHWH